MVTLIDLPNISRVTQRKLFAVGIKTPEELSEVGSKEAFTQIKHQVDQTACFYLLCALEGAIQGVQWHYLDEKVKQDLTQFYHSFNHSHLKF